MAFREVSVVQIKEALRRWLKGEGERPIAQGVGVDRKTARRYIAAAVELGVDRKGGEDQLTDELIGRVCERSARTAPTATARRGGAARPRSSSIKAWVNKGLTVAKIGILLDRSGIVVPPRTLARFAVERCGAGGARSRSAWTTRRRARNSRWTSAGWGSSPTGTRRGCATGSSSWPVSAATSSCGRRSARRTEEVIRGFEAAWGFFGGVFPVVIPDNMSSIVIKADNTAPRFNDVFFEYAQSRGFLIDAARVRTPTDKPRVERVVHYVRNNFFAGETFVDLDDCRARAETWCADDRRHAHPRHHPVPANRGVPDRGTATAAPGPGAPFDTPVWSDPKVHRDCHVEVARAIYSVPHTLVGRHLRARRDPTCVKLYLHGELVKVHPRQSPWWALDRPG